MLLLTRSRQFYLEVSGKYPESQDIEKLKKYSNGQRTRIKMAMVWKINTDHVSVLWEWGDWGWIGNHDTVTEKKPITDNKW